MHVIKKRLMTCRSTKNRFLADEYEGQLSSLLHSVIVLFNSLNTPPQSTVCTCCLSKNCRFESMWKLLLVCFYFISNVPGRSYPRGEQIRGAGHHQRFSGWPHSDRGNIQWVGTDHTRCDPIAYDVSYDVHLLFYRCSAASPLPQTQQVSTALGI